MINKYINVIESFLSFQGEGKNSGERVLILRFKRCSRAETKEHGGLGKKCPWCDTFLRMRINAETELTLSNIQQIIDNEKCSILLTGGEPTFGPNLFATINVINNIQCNLINVETNGHDILTLFKEVNKKSNIIYSLSPKLFDKEDEVFYKNLIQKTKTIESVHIKLVYEDRPEIINFLDYLQEIEYPKSNIWLMPEGQTKEEILEHAPKVFDAAEKYKTNFSSRDHIIYGFV